MAADNVVKTLTIKATTEGVDQATASLQKLGDAQQQVAIVSEQSAKASLSVDRALQNLQRRYDQEFRAQQDLAKVQKTLDQARGQGLITQQQQNDLMQKAIVFHNQNKEAVTLHASAMKELQTQAEIAAANFGPLGSILTRLGPAGLAVAAAFGGVAIALHAAAEAGLALADRAGKLKDLSETIGLTVVQLQALEIAAGRSGVGQQELAGQLEKLSVAFADVRNRTGGAFEALSRINPQLAVDVSNAKSLAEALDLLATGFKGVDESSRNLAARQIFGRGGIGITRVLDEIQGAGGLQGFIEQLNQTDLLTNQQADDFKKLGDAINEAFRLAKQNVQATFGPTALAALDSFSAKMLELSRTLKEMAPGQAFKDFMDWLIDPRIIKIVTDIANFSTAPDAVLARIQAQQQAQSGGAITPPTVTTVAPKTTIGAPGQGMFPGFDSEEATTRARGLNMLKQAMTALSDETDKSSKSNDDWRTKAIQAANDSQRLTGALGGTATASETLQNQILQLNKQAAEGKISFQQAAEAIGRLQAQFNLSQLQANVTALGSAATSTEKYQLAVAQLEKKLKDAEITQQTFNRAVAGLDPTVKALTDTVTNVGSAMAAAFIQGQDAAQAFNSALKAVATTAASGAIKDLIKGISGQGFDFTSIATGGVIALGATVISKLFSSDDAKKQEDALKKLDDASKQAAESLNGVVKSFNDLVAVASGPVTTAIKNAQTQFAQLVTSAQASQFAAIASFFGEGATAAQQASAIQAFQSAFNAIGLAGTQLNEFNQRTLQTAVTALRGSDALTDVQQSMADLRKQAADLAEAYATLGIDSAAAAQVINENLNVALQRLTQQVAKDLTRQINELTDRDWVNQVLDLIQTVKDATAAMVDPGLVEQFRNIKAQDIVNQAELTGDAFNELLAIFPDLVGPIHEFNAALEDTAATVARIADELQSASDALRVRFFQATQDQTTLENQLALFNFQAQREIEAEVKAGGENLLLLEQTLYVERLKLVKDFNDQVVADQKQAFDSILDYVNGLLTGTDSPLSPSGRLAQAQQLYGEQLALAQAGDISALQNLTQFAESLRTAAQAFYGSSFGYQNIFSQIQSDLRGLTIAGGQYGGMVVGGVPGKDSVPLLAMPGEFLIRRSVAQIHGRSLAHLNQTGQMPANDNLIRIENILMRILALTGEGNEALEINTQVIASQTDQLSRQERFTARRLAG